MLRLLLDSRASKLLEPVQESLDRAVRLLPGGPPLSVRLATIDRPYLVGTAAQPEVVLSDSLLGNDVNALWEPEGPFALDRWRRAVCCILEGAALVELARRTDCVPQLDDWRWIGAAIYVADATAPEMGLPIPDIATALTTADLGIHPRAGVAAYLAWRQSGLDPIQQAQYLIDGGIVSGQEWLRLGGWIFDPVGLRARMPSPVASVPATDIPTTLAPWSWRPLRVPAHRRGGHVDCDGPGAVRHPWAAADVELDTLAGTTDGPSHFTPAPGGPVGTWEVASAEAFGQIVGARGIQFEFRPDGVLELILADAFVGPLAAVAMAEELGTSGSTFGHWRVDGPSRLGFSGLREAAFTMHGHQTGFAMPTGGFGLQGWLTSLCDGPWAWKAAADRLVLRGTMKGGTVEVRLRPV